MLNANAPALRRGRQRIDYARGSGVRGAAVAILPLVAGCGVAPSVSIFGSFFPAWLICIVVGVVLTILTRQIFVATKIAPHISPAPIVYPCLAAAWIFATWLLVFQS